MKNDAVVKGRRLAFAGDGILPLLGAVGEYELATCGASLSNRRMVNAPWLVSKSA